MFAIVFTPEARDDLKLLSKFDRGRIVEAIESQLPQQAQVETRNRKRLRPNQVSNWELRVGDFRVFYDVSEDDEIVRVKAVGYKKGGKLFLHGREVDLTPSNGSATPHATGAAQEAHEDSQEPDDEDSHDPGG